MKKTILALATVASMFAGSAFAQSAYVGAGIGQGHVNADCAGTDSCDNNGTGFKVFGGYKFTPNLAAELSYFDFGKATATSGALSGALRTTAFGLGGAYLFDFAPKWNGALRLGVASVKMKADATYLGQAGSASESSTQPYVGFSVGYEVAKGLSITGALDATRGKILGQTGNVRLLTVGVSQAF